MELQNIMQSEISQSEKNHEAAQHSLCVSHHTLIGPSRTPPAWVEENSNWLNIFHIFGQHLLLLLLRCVSAPCPTLELGLPSVLLTLSLESVPPEATQAGLAQLKAKNQKASDPNHFRFKEKSFLEAP